MLIYLGYKSKKYLHIVVVVYTKFLYKKILTRRKLNARNSTQIPPPYSQTEETPPSSVAVVPRFRFGMQIKHY